MPPEGKLKAWYTVPELAGMAGTTRDDIRRVLRLVGVPIDDTGRTGRVFLADIRRHAPEVWASILLVVSFRAASDDAA